MPPDDTAGDVAVGMALFDDAMLCEDWDSAQRHLSWLQCIIAENIMQRDERDNMQRDEDSYSA